MDGIRIEQIGGLSRSTLPVKLKKRFMGFLNGYRLPPGTLGARVKLDFYNGLSAMLEAGLDLRKALEIIRKEYPAGKERTLFSGIETHVLAGSALSDAMNRQGKYPPFEYYTLQIGEETGQLASALSRLAEYTQGRIDQKRQVISVAAYPAVIISAAMAAVFFMVKFMVPMFADVFSRFGGELPALTEWIIKLSRHVSGIIFFGLIALSAIALIAASQRKHAGFRKVTSALVLRIPLAGTIVRLIYLERFCGSMHLLVSARVPLLRALTLVEKMIRYHPVENALHHVQPAIVNGVPFHAALEKFRFFDAKILALIKVGEETNRLDRVFEHLSRQYRADIRHRTSLIGILLEPAIIIILGVIVGIILAAMYLPLFQLGIRLG